MSHLFALFLVTSFANIVTPGMTITVMVVLAAQYGWKKTLPSIIGTAVGLACIYAIGLSGIGLVIATSPWLFALIKLLGALFLFYLAWTSWKKAHKTAVLLDNLAADKEENTWEMFKKGYLVTITNPQPIIFCLSIFPQFIDPALSYWPQVLLMLSVYLILGILVKIVYVLLADRARVFLLKGDGPRLIHRTSAVIFTLIGSFVLWNAASNFF